MIQIEEPLAKFPQKIRVIQILKKIMAQRPKTIFNLPSVPLSILHGHAISVKQNIKQMVYHML